MYNFFYVVYIGSEFLFKPEYCLFWTQAGRSLQFKAEVALIGTNSY